MEECLRVSRGGMFNLRTPPLRSGTTKARGVVQCVEGNNNHLRQRSSLSPHPYRSTKSIMVSECAREGTREVVSSGALRDGEAGRSRSFFPEEDGSSTRTSNEKIASPTHLHGRTAPPANFKLLAWIWACSCPSHLWTNVDSSSTLLSSVPRLPLLPIHYPRSYMFRQKFRRRKWPIYRSQICLQPPRRPSTVPRRRQA